MTNAACGGILMALFSASSLANAQIFPAPASGTPATALQAQALEVFRPHVEQLCQTLYARPDVAESCVQRVFETAIPLDLEPASAPAFNSTIPWAKTGTGTVAPDGRE
jgi:hypothetical protein